VDNKQRPFRKCIGCRAVRPKSELLRFVKEASAHVEFDLDGTLKGRGFYLCPNEKCLGLAYANKKTRAAYFRKQEELRETIAGIQETILKSIEKDLILCKKMGYLIDARNEEMSLGGDGLALGVRVGSPEERGEMHTPARSSQARFFLLPETCFVPAGSCAVGTGFPRVKRLAMNLQKYEMLSSKGPAL
jgi:uncharacterized protein